MLKIETKELKISDKLKRQIDMIGRFTNTTPVINNGFVKNIIGTNVAYVMPHIIVIKNNKYLMFDECDVVYINTFNNKIEFKDLDYKKKMTEAYKKQVDDLELIVPNFIVCSAIIHYDETSPHMHVVGVPIKYNCKNGMSIQVGKTDVFTRESLRKIQDKMRTLCIEEYNNEYNLSSTLKKKLKGRNRDIHISNMNNYQETKDLIEKNQKNIDSINNKSLELEKENLNIKDKITTLKKAPLTKDSYLISIEDKQKIGSYIDKIDKVNEEYRNIKELSSSLNSLSQTIKEDKETIKILTENNKSLELRVSNLTSKNSKQEERIDELRKDNFNLKYRVQQLEEFFNRLIKLIKNMFKRSDKKEQYAEFANDLYRHQIFSDKTMDDIRIAYNTKTKEKDDFEL